MKEEDICLFVRHAAAQDALPGTNDRDANLTERGRAQAEALREWMCKVKFDAVWSSPALRAVHTAQLITAPASRRVIIHTALYGDVDIRDSSRLHLQRSCGTTLIVGHDQNLQRIAYLMSGRHLHLRTLMLSPTRLPNCGMFEVRFGPTNDDVSVRMIEWEMK